MLMSLTNEGDMKEGKVSGKLEENKFKFRHVKFSAHGIARYRHIPSWK